jgi:hypothetical protein
LVLAFVLGTSVAVAPEDVERGRVTLSPPCHFKALFGRDCPTCGLTRGFMAMGHGRFGDAWRYNRAAPFLYFLGWAGVAAAAALLVSSRRRSDTRGAET